MTSIKFKTPIIASVFFGAIYLLLLSANAWSIACDAIFTNGIQATGASGNINLSYHSAITGGSSTLKTKTLTDNTAWVACSGSSCAATGTVATTSPVTFSTGTGSNGAITLAANSTLSKASGDYSTVSVGQQATLTFSTASGTYKTTGFTTAYQSVVQLQSGDYWINGNLTIGQETVLKRVATSGSTRIFVNGNISLDYKVTTQSFTSDQLLIYATGTITSANEANLSAFIYAGGNVSFNYLSVINGGVSGANFTASGNQVTVNYQPSALTSASFSPFCSGTTSAPVLLGSWNMDEGSWNGSAGEVIDSSGNGNHGKASVAVAGNTRPSTTSGSAAYTSGAQSTCRYGAFDGTGGSPTRTYDYIELSGFPTLPNGFTFAAWIRSTNASAQHQRILVRDDAQNGWGLSLADGTGSPELRFFNRNVTNNGAVTGQGTDPNCGVFCVDTTPIITSNTWYYVAAAVDTTGKTVTLYVYSQAGSLLAKAVGAYSGTWVDGTGTVAIGGETSASSEGQQTSWHFLGNIDEVNMYSGALSQASIASLMTTVRTCPAPDHYELEVPTSGVACLGTDVTVRACADSAIPCNQDNTVSTNVTLAASSGSLNATTVTLTNGSGTTKLKYPAAADGASSTVTLSGEVTAATNSRKCCSSASSCTVANSCSTTFKTAGFMFPDTAAGSANSLQTQIAGTTGNNAYIRAIQTNTTTGACMARFTSPQVVPLAYKCMNPTTCIAGQTFTLGSTSLTSNAASASPIVYTNVSLNFDSQGSAQIPITYSDVGSVQLFANLALASTSTEPAYTLTGQSNAFVVKPYTIAITSVKTASKTNPGGTTAAGTAAGFAAANTPFQVDLEVRNSLGARTPNFGKESTYNAEVNQNNITLGNLAVVYPTGGAATSLSGTTGFSATSVAGAFTNANVIWNQVGSFTVQPVLADSDYLGGGNITLTTSATIGRFYPDHYTLVPTSLIINSCTSSPSLLYMGQSVASWVYVVQAQNASNGILSNYGLYGNPAAKPYGVAENANNGTNLITRLSAAKAAIDTGTWSGGIWTPNGSIATFDRAVTPDGPYSSLQPGLGVTDTFDLRSLTSTNMNASTTGSCSGATCTEVTLGSPWDVRFGRLRLDDAFGPESAPLVVNFITEYWSVNHFTINTVDSCTVVPRANITYPSGTLATDTNRTVSLTGGTTQGTYNNINNTGVVFNAGTAGQKFTAPSGGGTGAFIVKVSLIDLPWLRFDWDQDGDYSDDTSLPNATFTFGSYRGNDRVIYWRERLQ